MQKKNPLIRFVGQLFTNAICPKVLRQLGFLSSAAIIIVMVVSPPFTLPYSYNSSIWPSTASSVDHGKPSSFCCSFCNCQHVGLLCCWPYPLKYDFCGRLWWQLLKHGHPDRQTDRLSCSQANWEIKQQHSAPTSPQAIWALGLIKIRETYFMTILITFNQFQRQLANISIAGKVFR